MGLTVPSSLPSDLDVQKRHADRRLGLCVQLRTCTEQPFYKLLFFRAQDLMINGGGGEGSGKRRNNGGCADNAQMLNEWAIKQEGKKNPVAFLGREGNPL